MAASISLAQARRIALGAQGFADPPVTGTPTIRHLRRVLDRVKLIQIDSVNVVQRAHYMPAYSRLGAYPTGLLDRAAYRSTARAPRELFEYWGHEASLLPVSLHPLMRWRMAEHHRWGGVKRELDKHPGITGWVLDEVRDRGPVTSAEIEGDVPRRKDNWGWNWSVVKMALEWLFWTGEVAAAARTTSFARLYDLPERVLPPEIMATPTPTVEDAHRELVRIAASALGVAAEPELRDYFRIPSAATKAAIAELVDAGELIPVEVEGWQRQGYLWSTARVPRRIGAATLVNPFDPLVWHRDRAARLFEFGYRIEIYVPAPQRVYGYYVLPFLLGDRLVARVDLKADRQAGILRVPAAWIEPAPARMIRDGHPSPGEVAEALAAELRRLAGWLGLGDVAEPDRGDLAGPLAEALGFGSPVAHAARAGRAPAARSTGSRGAAGVP